MRNYRNICAIIIVVITAILLNTGCTEGRTNSNASVTYEPFVGGIYWEENMPDFEKTFSLGNEDSPPEYCAVLSEKMKLLNLEMPLDSEDRIIAYAWELARMMDECENIEEEKTVWYVGAAYHYPEGVWLIHYIYRSNLIWRPDGPHVRAYGGGALTFAVSEDDGEILNAMYLPD